MQEKTKKEHLTFNEAKKLISSMNLINDFLWTSANEDKDDAKKIAGIILSTVLGYKVEVEDVETQKVLSGVDTIYHGIRMDAHILSSPEKHKAISTSYDIEMEDRESDRPALPRRSRFYSAISDSKNLPSGDDYLNLPDFISITILSYDPFLLGDMYYIAKSKLITHPDYDYDDGRTNIFLYAGGKPNFPNESYGKKVSELLKYIVSGTVPASPDKSISELDNIVQKVKSRPEVTIKLMKQWDRERIHDFELTRKDAIKLIRSNRRHNIPDEATRQDIIIDYGYDSETIDALFKEVDTNCQVI